jgi:uncharacterized protein (DUF2252 family)
MSFPLKKHNEKAHASFIAIKKQLYSNETCMNFPLKKHNERAHASFIAIKKQLYSNENLNLQTNSFSAYMPHNDKR